MVSKPLSGPPFVIVYGSSNNCNVPIVENTTVNKNIGFNCGIVIKKNFLILPAPSISAASYKSEGIFCNPARNITILYPVHLQVITVIKEILAQNEFSNQPTLSIPNRDRM